MSEALNCIIKNAFDGKLHCENINRIQADTIPGNIASEKTLMKLGFNAEGTRLQAGYWKNSYHDLHCYGLLRDNFRSSYG